MSALRIIASDFVKRQTKESRFSYFDGTWEELAQLAHDHLESARQGYRHGVILVPVPADRFYTATVELTEDTPVHAKVTRRREGEDLFVSVTVDGQKTPAKFVDLVLYAHHVLAENNEQTPGAIADYEIVSINARLQEEPEPIPPLTMARNFLQKQGGTKGYYTAEEFANSIWYWSNKTSRE